MKNMKNKIVKYSKIIIILLIIILFIWFLLIKPKYTFHNYEKTLESAAKRYYEINSDKLPTGKRTATIKMNELYHQSYLKEDMYIPYSKKACSGEDSWVKVRKDSNNEYKYYVYLECGALKSNIDHEGPIIKLNGNQEETIEINSKYNDPGIESVIDKVDGEIDKEDIATEGKVDTSKVGIYKIKYTAYDSLNNKTTITRTVTVVKTTYSEIKKSLGKEERFTGDPENNYINISKMDFRIVGIDNNKNIIVVSEDSISFVNGNKINDWLNDYYYNLFSNKAKKLIVESKYCNKVGDTTSTKCSGYTDNKKIYIPSISDVNKASNNGMNYLINDYKTWLSENDNKNKYVVNLKNGYTTKEEKEIHAIRPMFTIKGTTKIVDGKGTQDDPYLLEDYTKLKETTSTSKLQTGDIINDKNTDWRVIGVDKDGYAKVTTRKIAASEDDAVEATVYDIGVLEYNPEEKNNIGYTINNKSTKYVDVKKLTKHEIEVPIYKGNIEYGSSTTTKKYKVLLSAPNVFDIYSTLNDDEMVQYWFINSSAKKQTLAWVDKYGDVNTTTSFAESKFTTVVGFISNENKIVSGNGTKTEPYKIG